MKKLLILASIALYGCGGGWSRPNTTEAEFNQDRYQCERESAHMYPAQITQQQIGKGYQSPTTTNCFSAGMATQCTSTPGIYTQPQTYTEDANASNRSRAFNSCLSAKGYRFNLNTPQTSSSGTNPDTHSEAVVKTTNLQCFVECKQNTHPAICKKQCAD